MQSLVLFRTQDHSALGAALRQVDVRAGAYERIAVQHRGRFRWRDQGDRRRRHLLCQSLWQDEPASFLGLSWQVVRALNLFVNQAFPVRASTSRAVVLCSELSKAFAVHQEPALRKILHFQPRRTAMHVFRSQERQGKSPSNARARGTTPCTPH